LLGDLYFQKGDYPQAIRQFKIAFEANAGNEQTRANLIAVYHKYGQVLDSQKRHQEAITQFQAALVLEPGHINLHLSLANAYQTANNFDSAHTTFERILELDLENPQAKEGIVNLHIRRGNNFLNRKKYTSALKEFESIPEPVRNVGIYNTIGYLYLMKKQPLKALPAFETALTRNPRDKVAYQNLQSIESQLDQKLNKGEDSETVKNNLALVRNSLVICLIGRNEHLNAKAKYRSALDLAPDDSTIKVTLVNTGIRLAKEFKKKKWPKNMKEVIPWIQEQDPENIAVKQLLEDTS